MMIFDIRKLIGCGQYSPCHLYCRLFASSELLEMCYDGFYSESRFNIFPGATLTFPELVWLWPVGSWALDSAPIAQHFGFRSAIVIVLSSCFDFSLS